MKIKPSHAAVLLSTILCSPVFAEEPAQHATPMAAPGNGAMPDMMMGGMMSEERLKKKQEYELKIHDLSNKILAASNPSDRDRLKAEQLELMKEHQKEHHQMMQQMMMMHKMGGGGMGNMPGMPMQHEGNGGMNGMGGMQHNASPPASSTPAPASTQGH